MVLAVVFAEFDGFVNLCFSISDRLSHLCCNNLSCIFESLLNTLSQIFDKLSPFLNSPISMNLEGSS